jgi:hypothetical protein
VFSLFFVFLVDQFLPFIAVRFFLAPQASRQAPVAAAMRARRASYAFRCA